MKLNTKICTLLAVFGATIFAGCNTNPVVVSGGTDSTLLFTQDGRADEAGAVDILWVIDNSGSMAEEQTTLFANFNRLAKRLAEENLDYQLAVTTTDVKNKKGVLNTKPNPQIGAAANPGPSEVFEIMKRGIYCLADAERVAFENKVVAELNKTAPQPEDKVADYKELSDDVDKFVKLLEATGKVDDKTWINDNLIPGEEDDTKGVKYKTLKSYISSVDYVQSDGTVDEEKLTADFACLAFVGTSGWGIEKGIDATIEAINPDNYKDGAASKGFIRNKSKFAFVIISDENDCSSRDIEYQGQTLTLDGNLRDAQCSARVCDLFSTKGVPPEVNPLIPPKEAHEKILENLRAIKGDPEFEEKSVIAAAVTGLVSQLVPGDGENAKDVVPKTTKAPIEDINYLLPFVIKGTGKPEEVPGKKKEVCSVFPFVDANDPDDLNKSAELATTCSSALGQAASGDRYQELVETFTNHYPLRPDADSEVGELCANNFQGTLDAIAGLLAGQASTCISRVLAPCGEGVALGDPCGPEALGGTCVAMPNTNNKGLYCSSAIEIKLIEPTNDSEDNLVNSNLCVGDIGSHKKYKYSCTLDPSQYTLNECAPGAKGVRFQFTDPDISDKLGALKVEVNYVAFPREYESENESTD